MGIAIRLLAVLLFSSAALGGEILSLYPGIGSSAHYRHDVLLGDGKFPTYTLGAVEEPQPPDYVGPTQNIPHTDPIATGDFVKLPNGRYQVQFALGRAWPPDSRESVFCGFSESLQKFGGIDVFTAVSINLVGAYDSPPKAPQRVLVGAGIVSGGVTRWVEISLYSHGWDVCTPSANGSNPWGAPTNPGPCDTLGLYDRRSWFNPGGEIVQYSAPGLHQIGHTVAPLVPGNGWTQYLIDWGKLTRAYPWKDALADDAKVVGVYIGIESLSGTWAYVQVRDFATFSY